jgi:hypothetical protein
MYAQDYEKVHQGDLVYRARCMCPRKDTYKCEVGLGENGLCTPVKNCSPTLCPKYESEYDLYNER